VAGNTVWYRMASDVP